MTEPYPAAAGTPAVPSWMPLTPQPVPREAMLFNFLHNKYNLSSDSLSRKNVKIYAWNFKYTYSYSQTFMRIPSVIFVRALIRGKSHGFHFAPEGCAADIQQPGRLCAVSVGLRERVANPILLGEQSPCLYGEGGEQGDGEGCYVI